MIFGLDRRSSLLQRAGNWRSTAVARKITLRLAEASRRARSPRTSVAKPFMELAVS